MLNKIEVTGELKSCTRQESRGERRTVFYEAVIVNHHTPERGQAKAFEFTIVAFGDNGKLLSSFSEGDIVNVAGRLENYSGISRTTGQPYTSFYKIVAQSISRDQSRFMEREPVAEKKTYGKPIDIEDIPF